MMGAMKPPPLPAAPTPPTPADASIQLAGMRQRGVASPTLLTGGLGDSTKPNVAKKTLLGA